MKRLKLPYYIGFAVLLCLLLSSCAYNSSLSLSSSQNVPLLTKQHDVRIEVGTGTQNIGIQAAYAFTNHLEVMGNYSYGQANFPIAAGYASDGSSYSGNRNGGDLALGYFSKLDTNIPFEIFAGVERYFRSFSGDGFSTGFLENYTERSNITKPFVQADIGFKLNSWIQVGISCRIGYLILDHYLYNLTEVVDTIGTTKAFAYTHAPNFTVVEPSIIFRIGRGNLKFTIQGGESIVSAYERPAFYNVGLSYLIHGKTTKSKNQPKKLKTNFSLY